MSGLRDHLPDLPRVEQIRTIELLSVGYTVLFYDYQCRDWLRSIVLTISKNYVQLQALEGPMDGFTWLVDRIDLMDPELYLKYTPNDP